MLLALSRVRGAPCVANMTADAQHDASLLCTAPPPRLILEAACRTARERSLLRWSANFLYTCSTNSTARPPSTLSPPTMLPPIPVETIEHAISFLRGDIPSLAACSLTCRALLPISRVQLWHEVVLPVQSDGSHSSRTETFIGVLNRNPAIAPYVRSLVLHPRESLGNRAVPFNRAALNTLSPRLPALCSLRLRCLSMQCLYEVVTLIRDLPTLEALYLENVNLAGTDWARGWPRQHVPPAAGAVGGPPPVWSLRTLSLSEGATPGAEVARLAYFLEWARDSEYLPMLESLDFCSTLLSPDPSGTGGDMIAPGIPSFGSSLRHFGTVLWDVEVDMSVSVEGRAFSGLPASYHWH